MTKIAHNANWFCIAQRDIETFFDVEQKIDEEERKQRGLAAIDAFEHVFTLLTSQLHLKDKWGETFCHIRPFSIGAIKRSKKMEIDFTLGVSLYGWFIEAPIGAPEQIRHMKDDYWKHITLLGSVGKAELYDYGRPVDWAKEPEVRKLTQHKGSLVFSIARDYTLLAGDEKHIQSLGRIHIVLPIDSDEAAVTKFFKNGLNSLYQSNYLLYRARYLQHKRFLKNFQKNNSRDANAI